MMTFKVEKYTIQKKKLSYKPQSRSMIIHPANEEYRHGINEVIGNTRYCLAFFATVY